MIWSRRFNWRKGVEELRTEVGKFLVLKKSAITSAEKKTFRTRGHLLFSCPSSRPLVLATFLPDQFMTVRAADLEKNVGHPEVKCMPFLDCIAPDVCNKY